MTTPPTKPMSDARSCTCHPDEAPVPCMGEYALTHCKLKAAEIENRQLRADNERLGKKLAEVREATWSEAIEAAAKICGSLAETTYDAEPEFNVVLDCEAMILDLRKRALKPQEPKR